MDLARCRRLLHLPVHLRPVIKPDRGMGLPTLDFCDVAVAGAEVPSLGRAVLTERATTRAAQGGSVLVFDREVLTQFQQELARLHTLAFQFAANASNG